MVYLDKFYTKPEIALYFINKTDGLLGLSNFDLVIEPSAGNGSFYNQIKHLKKIGIDIEPDQHCKNIIKMDFFDYKPKLRGSKKILVIGNPPFGKISSLAIKFFNHASEWAECIAFIVPRTFRKVSVQNRLSLNFVLVKDEDVPTNPCSFVPKMSVKCCFQIWKRSETPRKKIILPLTHDHFVFINYKHKKDDVDLAIRAYGGKCGEIYRGDFNKLSPKSWHFIKTKIPIDEIIKNITSIDFKTSLNTARQNSVGRAEFVYLYEKVINSES